MVGTAAAEYHRRICVLLSEFPLLILWLPQNKPSEPCRQRQRVVKDLLSRELKDLDVTSAKIRELFAAELKQTADDGTLCPQLYAILLEFRKQLVFSAQIIESANSIITKMTGLAPYMEHQLASSRVTQKKEVLLRGGDHEAILSVSALADVSYQDTDYKAINDYSDRWLELGGRSEHYTPMPLMDDFQKIYAGHICDDDAAAALAPAPLGDLEDRDLEAAMPPAPAAPEGPERAAEEAGPDGLAEEAAADRSPEPDKAGDERAKVDWASCQLFTAKRYPRGITRSILANSARAALRWSYAFEIGPATRCFWIGAVGRRGIASGQTVMISWAPGPRGAKMLRHKRLKSSREALEFFRQPSVAPAFHLKD